MTVAGLRSQPGELSEGFSCTFIRGKITDCTLRTGKTKLPTDSFFSLSRLTTCSGQLHEVLNEVKSCLQFKSLREAFENRQVGNLKGQSRSSQIDMEAFKTPHGTHESSTMVFLGHLCKIHHK